jgi:regulator of sigma E protease
MNGFLVSALAFLAAISVLVVVHELGHYLAARAVGVKVLRFSVGFGKPLWMRCAGRDRTEWVIAALPFGGYVKMLDEGEGEVAEAERHRAFNRQSLWRRAIVVIAGPAFNLLFAVIAYAAVYMMGIEGLRPVVGEVAASSIAAQAGFRPGDEIRFIDDKPVVTWDQRRLYLYQQALGKQTVVFTVRDERGALTERHLDLSSLSTARIGAGLLERDIGLVPQLPAILPVIGHVEPGSVAEAAGLKVGDRLVGINGQPVPLWKDAAALIAGRPEQKTALAVERQGRRLTVEVTPRADVRDGQRVGRLGIGVQAPVVPASMRAREQFGFVEAIQEGTDQTWLMSSLTLQMLWKMLALEVSTETISGPVTIAQFAGASAQVGLDRFLLFLAVVSVSLGVLNLLPVPVLDGGHLLIYIVEAIRRRPLSEQALLTAQRFGFAVLGLLMVLAFYNDLRRLFS